MPPQQKIFSEKQNLNMSSAVQDSLEREQVPLLIDNAIYITLKINQWYPSRPAMAYDGLYPPSDYIGTSLWIGHAPYDLYSHSRKVP